MTFPGSQLMTGGLPSPDFLAPTSKPNASKSVPKPSPQLLTNQTIKRLCFLACKVRKLLAQTCLEASVRMRAAGPAEASGVCQHWLPALRSPAVLARRVEEPVFSLIGLVFASFSAFKLQIFHTLSKAMGGLFSFHRANAVQTSEVLKVLF